MEISEIVTLITGMDVKQFISISFIIWFYTRNLKKDILRIESKQNHTEEKINDIMMKLARIEGMLTAKECCLLVKDEKIKKAE